MKVIVNLSAIISFLIGFFKMLYYDGYTNIFVNGDAYNFIINGTHAIAMFVLGLAFVLISCTMSIMEVLSREKNIEE